MQRLATRTLCAMVLVLGAAGSGAQQSDGWTFGERRLGDGSLLRDVRRGQAEGVNTIQYDPGTPLGVREADPPFHFLGNNFDSQFGSPLTGGSLSGISFYAGEIGAKGSTDMYVRFLGGGGTLTGAFLFPNTAYAFNAFTFAPFSLQPPFFAGLYAPGPGSPLVGTPNGIPSLGFATGSNNGQGFHASQITFSGTVRTAIPGQNIVLRVTGSIAIPVELLEFDVE